MNPYIDQAPRIVYQKTKLIFFITRGRLLAYITMNAGVTTDGRVRSLFIVSLPRSLSTLIHYHSSLALQFRSPAWVDAGEVLNPDRLTIASGDAGSEAGKFTPPEQTLRFARLSEFLDDVIKPYDSVYKDVVQPFVVSQWLRKSDLAVLHIRRPVAEVAWAMLKRRWLYPANAAPPDRPETYRLIAGLIKATHALETVDAEHVDFAELTGNEESLTSALRRLYPDHEIPAINYIDREFRDRAASLQAERCADREWEAFQREVSAISL